MKKILSLVVVCAMIIAVFPAVSFASTESDFPIPEKVMLVENDFSELAVGEVLKNSKAKGSISITDNDDKGVYIGTKDPTDAGNMCVSITLTKASGPRLAFTIDPANLTKFSVEYRSMAKSSGGAAASTSIGFHDNITDEDVTLYSVKTNTWKYVKCECDTAKNTVKVYTKNTAGASYSLNSTINYTFANKFQVRFVAAGSVGYTSYFDDLAVYTYDRTPTGKSAIFFGDDFEHYEADSTITSSSLSPWNLPTGAVFKAVDGAKYSRNGMIGAFRPSSDTASITGDVYVGAYEHFTATAFLNLNTQASCTAYLSLADSSGNVAGTATIPSNSGWHFVRIDVDKPSKYVRVMIDGTKQSFSEASALDSDETDFVLTIGTNGASGKTLYVDSVNVFDDDLSIDDDGNIDLSKFVYRPKGVTPFGDVLRNSHPRVMVTDFADIYNKVISDGIAVRYFEANYETAEKKYDAAPIEFDIYQRPNSYPTTLTTSRNLENMIVTYSFVYNVEKERIKAGACTYDYVLSRGYSADTYGSEEAAINEYKNHVEGYKARALGEIYNAGTYPTWLPQTTICMSEAANGVALGYDWLYSVLNDVDTIRINEVIPGETVDGKKQPDTVIHHDTVKTKNEILDDILEILMQYSGIPYIQSYKNIEYGGWQTGKNNRTVVSAASAITVASAMYDKYRDAAEFMVQSSIEAMKYGLEPYKYSGSFPEGPGYWSYSTNFFCVGQSALFSMVGDSETVPQYAKLYETSPGLNTTGDYYVLFNGALGAFNYCDCGFSFSTEPALYYLADLFDRPEYAAYNRGLENRTLPSGHYSVYAVLWMNLEGMDIFDIDKLPLDKVYDADIESNVVFAGASFRSSFDSEDASWTAIRAGANNASHGNANGGEVVFESNGIRWLKLQDRHNYDDQYYFYNRRAEGHNTIVVNPAENGYDQYKKAYLKVLDHKETDGTAWAIVNMTQTCPVLTDAKRGILLTDHRKSLIVQDEFTASEPSEFYWFMHTQSEYDEIDIAPDGKSAVLSVAGERLYVHLIDPNAAGLRLDKMASLPLAPREEWYEGEAENVYVDPNAAELVPMYGYKLFVHADNATSFNLAVEFIPLEAGEEVPEGQVLSYAPMADWRSTDFDAIYPDPVNSYSIRDVSWYTEGKSQYTISTKSQLAGLAYLVNEQGVTFEGKTVRLADNIDLSDPACEWVAIGTSKHPFKGTFDGDGKAISNFTADTQDRFYGLFGVIRNAEVKNLILDKMNVDGGYGVGGIVGVAFDSDITNVSVSGDIIGTYYVGGIAGCTENTRITNCMANVNMRGKPVATNRAQGSGFVGGIVGFADVSRVSNCITNGKTENLSNSKQMCGRIAGLSMFSEFENVFYPNLSDLAKALNKYSSYTDLGTYKYHYRSGKIVEPVMNATASQLLSEYAEANDLPGWSSEPLPHIVVPSPDYNNNARFVLSEKSAGSNQVGYTITNISEDAASTYVVTASYKDGIMVSHKIKHITLDAGESKVVTDELLTTGCDTVYIFPWSTLSGMYTNGNMMRVIL